MGTVTVTEIEIYDTAQPPDTLTGRPPVKATIRQRTDRSGSRREVRTERMEETAAVQETVTVQGGELSEAVIREEKPPGLWERIRRGVMYGLAVLVPVLAVWIIFKLKKR